MADENPRWGYLRIVGECRKLGITVSATSVRSILRAPVRPGAAPRRAELDRVPAGSGGGDDRV
jgi:putative transposase